MDTYYQQQYETQICVAECSVCGRKSWDTTPRQIELGWQLRNKDTRCPAHTESMIAFAAELQATIASVRGGFASATTEMLERATIWREAARVNR